MDHLAADLDAEVSVDFGSADGFEQSVVSHLPTMRRVAAALGRAADPDEVVQDALVRAWRRRSTYRADRGTVRGWLLAIVANQARTAGGRAGAWHLDLSAAPDPGREDVIADVDLRRAISELAPRQRQTVLLHYYADLPVREVADLMACSEGTVKSTLSDARAHLATKLETRDV